YIMRKRLAKAETLMLTSDVVLSEIAILCGFTDQAHLCKLFRQQFGQSPAAWRRERTDSKKPSAHERKGLHLYLIAPT
ncbi:MAG TPA: helix-turn-helix domain-containing protein, partial [Terriglobales bacterium]